VGVAASWAIFGLAASSLFWAAVALSIAGAVPIAIDVSQVDAVSTQL